MTHLYEEGATWSSEPTMTPFDVACIHEAGHAVVSLCLGAYVKEVAVTRTDGDPDGYCITEDAPADIQTVTAMGGCAAEIVLVGHSEDRNSASDRFAVSRMGCDWVVALRRAKEIITGNLGMVRSLAEDLKKHQRLVASDILHALRIAEGGIPWTVRRTDEAR